MTGIENSHVVAFYMDCHHSALINQDAYEAGRAFCKAEEVEREDDYLEHFELAFAFHDHEFEELYPF